MTMILGRDEIWQALISRLDDYRIKLVRDTPDGMIDDDVKDIIIETVLWKAIEAGTIELDVKNRVQP